ncbi:MAG TPA: rhodanese-like domain-containing protein, partial [Gemmatimonadales bacterium]|nr:rhodanese-like domain-containing protein [Gemmatimonadales bacterium]
MTDRAVPDIAPLDLAQRLDAGERLQVLDVRAPERVAQGRVTLGTTLDFRAVPASEMYRLPTLEPLRLDRGAPVAVICGHGNSSRRATTFLRERGFEAYSVRGGMAAWESIYLPRPLTSTPAIEHVIQVDRVGKGAL